MKRMIVVVSLFVMLFVAVSPCFAGCPGCGGHRGGGNGVGQQVTRFAQRSAAGWGQAAQGTAVVARAVADQVASDAKAVGRAAKKLQQSTVNYGDSARIGQTLDNATSRAQGK
jgi:hypothetical protein